ncbi:glycerate dehydrogenase [Alicyclobacillus acidoterrestris]|uniref:2-hydroxyacid dehydrogenase n=1 Tax=Alicyclobacillus suci TaxID=2816080 RepID=UPI0011943424|nr:NAD(P)-dependent oxidoreductase [Alicyclobacillus suci]GEO28068.1 glycerate dehydrogenase [Alicyclobacillus acidoterrestris]
MKITYIDEPTYLPTWVITKMREYGEVQVFSDRPDKVEAIKRLSNTDIAIVEWTSITQDMVLEISRLKYLIAITTSYDYIDINALTHHGILVSNCPVYSKQSVAEHVFALLFAINRKLIQADNACRRGLSHLYHPFLCSEIHGKTIGLVGTGQIGQAVAHIANAFQLKVLGTNKSMKPVKGIELVDIQDLMKRSDIVSLHLPANQSTIGIVTEQLLSMMRSDAFLINTCRGRLINEPALYDVLRQHRIRGAGLDDLTSYKDNPILKLDNVVLTPGSAWYSYESREQNMRELIQNIHSFFTGKVVNLVF